MCKLRSIHSELSSIVRFSSKALEWCDTKLTEFVFGTWLRTKVHTHTQKCWCKPFRRLLTARFRFSNNKRSRVPFVNSIQKGMTKRVMNQENACLMRIAHWPNQIFKVLNRPKIAFPFPAKKFRELFDWKLQDYGLSMNIKQL